MKILVVIPFCETDAERALKLLEWIQELGGCHENECLFVVSGIISLESIKLADRIFKSHKLAVPPFPLKDERHPFGPNWMFETTLKHLHKTGETRPFLWLEPDAVPLRKGWLQDIEAEYEVALKRGRTVLADVVALNDPKYPKRIPSGVAVYPGDAWKHYKAIQTNRGVAWDIQFADRIMPHVHNSTTIENRLNRRNAPTFVAKRTSGMADNNLTLDDIPRGVALYHPSKDGTLIALLRDGVTPTAMQLLAAFRSEQEASTTMAYVPRKAKPLRYIHCVERHVYENKADNERVLSAFYSWVSVYKQGRMVPQHIWDYPRHSGEIGDQRRLPYLKDILVEGMTLAGPDDVIVITNDDTIFHSGIVLELDDKMSQANAIGSMRLNFHEGKLPPLDAPIEKIVANGKPDLGRDLMAFRKSWLIEMWNSIPDFILGEQEWDLVLTAMIRRSAGINTDRRNILNPARECEIANGFVLHQFHDREWIKERHFNSPAKDHNRKLAVRWYAQNGMPSLIQA